MVYITPLCFREKALSLYLFQALYMSLLLPSGVTYLITIKFFQLPFLLDDMQCQEETPQEGLVKEEDNDEDYYSDEEIPN